MRRLTPALMLLAAAPLVLAGCTAKEAATRADSSGPITVTASEATCKVSATTAAAGTLTFIVNNTGSVTTEFYLYATGNRVLGEVENIAPGVERRLVVEVPDAGTYTTACKPGMVGDGIRADFTVTGTATR